MSGHVGTVPPGSPQGAAPPHSLEAEQAVLGGLMLAGEKVIGVLYSDEGLRPEHFYRLRHRLMFEAALAVVDQGGRPDHLAVSEQLRVAGTLDQAGGPAAVDALAGAVPSLGNVRRYARTVVELARWRARLSAAFEMQAAAIAYDDTAFAEAEAKLARPAEGVQRAYDKRELGMSVARRIQGADIKAFPWPFEKFNVITRGGMRRGQVTLVTGPTRHGKSVFLDMALEAAADSAHAPKVGLFLNEMGHDERGMRIVSRRGKVSYEHLELASVGQWQLSVVEAQRVIDVLQAMPFEIVECAGWTAAEICREARRRRFDVVGVDIIQRLPHRMDSRVRELEQASNDFDRLAKETGAHVLITAHINRGRRGLSAVVPMPSMDDIRDCAQLANDADNVVIVWRDQDDDTGDPERAGIIRFAKVRGGKPGGLAVEFWGDHQEFEPDEPVVAAA